MDKQLVAFSNMDFFLYNRDDSMYHSINSGLIAPLNVVINGVASRYASVYGYELDDMDSVLDLYNVWKGMSCKITRAKELSKNITEYTKTPTVA